MIILNALPGAIAQGLIWGIMAIGLFISYKVLDFADLTVDGSFCTGGAVCALLMVNGVNVWAALLAAIIAGALAGLITGVFNTLMGIPEILLPDMPSDNTSVLFSHDNFCSITVLFFFLFPLCP